MLNGGSINCPPNTWVSLEIEQGGTHVAHATATDSTGSARTKRIHFTWPNGFNLSGQVTNADDIPEEIGIDGGYGDLFGPQTTEYVVSGGDGRMAFSWFTSRKDTPTAGGAGTVGSIDAYLVQYRVLTDETDTEGNGLWGSRTTVAKATADREHKVTGFANGTYNVRVRARSSDGDDGDAMTTDRQRYGLFYETTVDLSSDKGANPPWVRYRDVIPGTESGSSLVRWREARAESYIHTYRYGTVRLERPRGRS